MVQHTSWVDISTEQTRVLIHMQFCVSVVGDDDDDDVDNVDSFTQVLH